MLPIAPLTPARSVTRPPSVRGSGVPLAVAPPPAVSPSPVQPATATAAAPADSVHVLLSNLLAWVERGCTALTNWLNGLATSPQPIVAPGGTPGSPQVAATPMVQPAPAPSPAAPVRPVAASSTPRAFADALAQAPAGQDVTLGAGTYTFDNFTPNGDGANGANVDDRGLSGAGVDKTIIQMTPRTSTHAGDIPTEQYASNPLVLLRIRNGSPSLHDFTLQGTDQGHDYTGLDLMYTTGSRVSNVKVVGAPGSAAAPPGETNGISEYRADGSIYQNVEVDSAGVGASGFASDHSSNLTVQNGFFHGSGYAHGMALWEVNNANLVDCTASDNKLVGINLERMAGTVNIVRPVLRNNGECDIGAASDQGSCVVNIYDPLLAPGQKLKLGWGPEYMGKPNLQKKNDVHVYQNGVEVTDQVAVWV